VAEAFPVQRAPDVLAQVPVDTGERAAVRGIGGRVAPQAFVHELLRRVEADAAEPISERAGDVQRRS
jgi:hypothetical protein